MKIIPLVLLCFALAVPTATLAAPTGPLTVFAAASLTETFTILGKVLEQRSPGLRVIFSFAGSQQLAAQIEQGARADVFASADQRWMDYTRERGLILGTPAVFARNRLVVIVPRANPGRIARLHDLSDPGIKVVLAAGAVPVGNYAREALKKLSLAPGFPHDFAERVLRNVVSEEENVRGVVMKVQLGEADAGIVYRSDVTPATAGHVQVIEIPDRYNVMASYPIARVRGGANPEAAATFIDIALSPLGQRILRDHNFIPVASP